MRGSGDDVADRRMCRHDGRQRLEHQFVPLAGPEQTEAEDDLPTFQVQGRLDGLGIDQRNVRNAVRDHLDAMRIDAVRADVSRSAAAFDITTVALTLEMRLVRTSACDSVGRGRIVCSVATEGTRNARTKSTTLALALSFVA